MTPEIVVALLADRHASPGALQAAAETWAESLPRAAFFVCVRLEAVEMCLLEVLAWAGLPASRLFIAGAGYAGRLALSLARKPEGFPCAGVLAYDASPEFPADAAWRWGAAAIRLICGDGANPANAARLDDTVRQLQALGVDARGAVLKQPGLTPAAVRLGAAYLAELAAASDEHHWRDAAMRAAPAITKELRQ
jgi:hypothetical protein